MSDAVIKNDTTINDDGSVKCSSGSFVIKSKIKFTNNNIKPTVYKQKKVMRTIEFTDRYNHNYETVETDLSKFDLGKTETFGELIKKNFDVFLNDSLEFGCCDSKLTFGNAYQNVKKAVKDANTNLTELVKEHNKVKANKNEIKPESGSGTAEPAGTGE